MNHQINESFFIVTDSREKQPLFPYGPKATLSYGDYTIGMDTENGLKLFDDVVIVERKKSSEWAGNISSGRARFIRELERMKNCTHKYLVIEDDLGNVLEPAYSRVNRRFIITSTVDFSLHYGIQPIFAQSASLAAEFTKTLMERVIKKIGSDELAGTAEPKKINQSPINERIENGQHL